MSNDMASSISEAQADLIRFVGAKGQDEDAKRAQVLIY